MKKRVLIVLAAIISLIICSSFSANSYAGLKITITQFVQDDSIGGVVQGLSASEVKLFKIIVYVKTNKLYIHPFETGGERETYSSIDSSGNWWVRSEHRKPAPSKIFAFMVKKEYKAPLNVQSIREIAYKAYDSIKYSEDAVK